MRGTPITPTYCLEAQDDPVQNAGFRQLSGSHVAYVISFLLVIAVADYRHAAAITRELAYNQTQSSKNVCQAAVPGQDDSRLRSNDYPGRVPLQEVNLGSDAFGSRCVQSDQTGQHP